MLFGGQLPGYLAVFHRLPKVVQSAAYTEFALAGFSLGMAVAAAMTLQLLTRRHARWAAAVALATGVELLLVASNRPMNTGEGGWKRHDSTRQVMRDPQLLSWIALIIWALVFPRKIATLNACP